MFYQSISSIRQVFKLPFSIILFNGQVIVDGFFGLGGLLLAYNLLGELNKCKRFNFITLILSRFFR